ncbi:glycerol-3-phosphate 1-O-acyltransferase PlsY [Chitinivorax sp. B]|uniref:glycerol-3-phosphate 1-O-acyltransferase PlsY n=1 Tax=Chitinivorax sp. B TaxID=2502235 RepID=UPI0010F6816B|nr:glycerol-3-phosphate 1-O-acyltransferase PlsY [Chitinivorax sp. B]
MLSIASAVVAYLIGSLSFAVLVSRVFGLADPRTYGSNNPGATNVLRSGNKAAAVLTLLGDALKGWLAVFLANMVAPQLGLTQNDIALVALAVVVGHMWPVFFRFKGGKGVATAAGVLFALNLWVGLATLLVWMVVALLLRISSLAALCAAIASPIVTYRFIGHTETVIAVTLIAALLIWRHKQNILGLLAGKEGRIGERAE